MTKFRNERIWNRTAGEYDEWVVLKVPCDTTDHTGYWIHRQQRAIHEWMTQHCTGYWVVDFELAQYPEDCTGYKIRVLKDDRYKEDEIMFIRLTWEK